MSKRPSPAVPYWRAVCACGWIAWGSSRETVAQAADRHSAEGSGDSLRVEAVRRSRATATALLFSFDPVQVFRPADPLTTPLLRLMLATDDVRLAQRLFLETSERLQAATDTQRQLLAGEQWYGMRLLCSHLHEAIDALATLRDRFGWRSVRSLLKGQEEALVAFQQLRALVDAKKATREHTFLFKARNWIGAHYRDQEITRLFGTYADSGYITGMVAGSDVPGLARFVLTDSLATLVLLDAAGARPPAVMTTEADHTKLGMEVAKALQAFNDEILPLGEALPLFVDSLVHTLVRQRGDATVERVTIEIPPLLRAAAETVARRRARKRNGP